MKLVVFSEVPAPAQEDATKCVVPGYLLQNQAEYSYTIGDAQTSLTSQTNSLNMAVVNGSLGTINPSGISDGQGNQVVGAFSGALATELINLGFSAEEASTAMLAVLLSLSQMPIDSTFREMAIAGRDAIVQAVPQQAQTVLNLDRQAAQDTALVLLTSVSKSILLSSGFTETEAETAITQGIATLARSVDDTPVNQAFDAVYQTAVGAVPGREATLTEMRQNFIQEIKTIRDGVRQSAQQGDLLYFDFQVANNSDRAVRFLIPDATAIQPLTTGGQVRGVKYSWLNLSNASFLLGDCPTPPTEPPTPPTEPPTIPPGVPPEQPLPSDEPKTPGSGTGTGQPGTGTGQPGTGTGQPGIGTGQPGIGTGQPGIGSVLPTQPLPENQPSEAIAVTQPTEVIIPPGAGINLTVEVEVGPVGQEGTGITVAIPQQDTQQSATQQVATQTLIIPPAVRERLRDPLGQITGCAGEVLSDYTGFQVALFDADPADPTGGVLGLLPLTPTELPDRPDNNIPEGLAPNIENANPFFLTNGEFGTYNFLFDATKGQLDVGRTYILVVTPPPGTNFNERRIRIEIVERNGDQIVYIATALDGRPIAASNGSTSVRGTVTVSDAERVGLNLAVLDFNTSICEARELEITKTGDRIVAAPGDTVIYRLAIRNLSNSTVTNLSIADQLPFGMQFRPDSPRAEIAGTRQGISASESGRNITFNLPEVALSSGETLNIAYAARVTPDALRGDGRNSAIVNGQRTDNGLTIKDGPAIHKLNLDPGILSDCGTLVGRVFEDKNFDGEQQTGEPGIPNAIIFMDDGNRIITDENGLFSVANVRSGYRTATLDLTSVPGYRLATNDYVYERNSVTRMVKLAPGGMGKMNFAVTNND
jgi:uncharacterized repeat protein (TIGR01451 family)